MRARFPYLTCLCLTLGALVLMQSRASAQTFNFTFSGGGATISAGTVLVSAGNITSISGTASGLTGAGIGDGAFIFNTSLFTGTFSYTSPANYSVDVFTNSGSAPYNEFFLSNGSSQVNKTNGGSQTIFFGSSTFSNAAASPAPVPGAGTLSWLVMGFGIAIVRRKAISAVLRSAYSRIAGRASA